MTGEQIGRLAEQILSTDLFDVLRSESLSADDFLALSGTLSVHHVEVRLIDGALLNGKADLLNAIAKEFEFPSYFGHNWDAVVDCLSDLGWLPAKGYVLVLNHADGFAAVASEASDHLEEAVRAASDRFAGEGGGAFLKIVRA